MLRLVSRSIVPARDAGLYRKVLCASAFIKPLEHQTSFSSTELHFSAAPRTQLITSSAYYQKRSDEQKSGSWDSSEHESHPSSKLWWVLGTTAVLGCGLYESRHRYKVPLDEPSVPYSQQTIEVLKWIPTRTMSRVWGWMAERELPLWARKPLLGFYCRLYDCNLDEIQFEESQFDPKLEPLTGYDVLKRYTCLQQFFTRHLKSHVRPISDSLVVSPVDGKVLIVGEIKDGSRHIQQVKGVVYDINEFLGAEPKRQNRNTKLAHCIIYLAPGDYHGIHSPAHWDVKKRLHVPGKLFPVAPVVVKKITNLFAMNERVVLEGDWQHGYFSISPVGATNVGSIKVSFDSDVMTNLSGKQEEAKKPQYLRQYEKPVGCKKGEEVAFFWLGSTVVLVFEVPQDYQFSVKPGDTVRLGQSLGHFDR